MKHVIVGTAGHIDHGKTELVRALTGVDCDRLDEEKKRGITIDIGFAPLGLGGDVAIGFIDVPGHERFVKNMLAGVSGIDLVMLVVSAEESIKPQTREHFEICRLLGVGGGLVALTKADLADTDLREIVALEVREFVKGSFLEGAPVIPVSARTGEGMAELTEALKRQALSVEERPSTSFFRLPVDRSFSIRGFGTVVTGTLIAGEVRDGEEVEVYPRSTRARVRGIQVHGASEKSVSAGRRTALNLQGVEAPMISRGDVLAPPGFMRPSSLLDVELQLLPSAPAPLKDLARVRFHQGTSEVLARAKLIERGPLDPGARAFVQLRLETPGMSLPGDRFVIRQYSPMLTIGGGVVLDAHPEKHRGMAGGRPESLAALVSGGPQALVLHALRAVPGGLATTDLVVRTGRKPSEVARLTERLAEEGRIVGMGDGARSFLHRDVHERHRASVLSILKEHHGLHPLMVGLPREELRERAMTGAPAEIARLMLERMAAAGEIRFEKEFAAAASHQVSLGEEEMKVLAVVETAYRDRGLNPPASVEEVATGRGLDAARAQRIYHLLLSRGRLVRIKDGSVYHADSLEGLKAMLWQVRKDRPVLDVAAFKELTGTSRKNAIPLLEHLDAERVTRRRGNDREILPPPGAATS
jgi:selenocysteine-specific elongation factor